METDDLIHELVRELRPVRILASPDRRALLWLGPSFLYVALTVLAIGIRPDSGIIVEEPRFLLQIGAAAATAVLAAVAALCTVCPGRSAALRWLPTPALVIWLATLIVGDDGVCFPPLLDQPPLPHDAMCVTVTALLAAAPAGLLFVMLRRAAPISPVVTGTLAMLAATALAGAGVRFFDDRDDIASLLIWHFGVILILTLLGSTLGPWALPWPTDTRASRS